MSFALCIGRWGRRQWLLCSGVLSGLETRGDSFLGRHAGSRQVSAAPAMPSHFWEKVFEDHALPLQAAFPRAPGSAAPGSQPVSAPSAQQASVQAPGNHGQS